MRNLLALTLLTLSTVAGAADDTPEPWCAPELETLEGDVCFHAEPPREKNRTLVIFLHGLVREGAGWQHAQHRGIVRSAKRLGFSVLMPRGRTGIRKDAKMVSWPTNAKTQKEHEEAVLAPWKKAREKVEERQGAAFDEVFVVGFSNGAYYASSLAMRGRLDVDGYAVFAGGTDYGVRAEPERRKPVFVGICGEDGTAADGRALARALEQADWPHRSETRPVGHAIADAHLDHALAYLRKRADDGASSS